MVPFHTPPSLSQTLITLHSYSPQSIKGRALEAEIQALLQKGAVEPASLSPGFYSRMFVVTKASGGWRPTTDLSTLNHFISDPRRGCYMGLSAFIFFFFLSFFRHDFVRAISLEPLLAETPNSVCCLVLRSNCALLLTIQFTSLFYLFILSNKYVT